MYGCSVRGWGSQKSEIKVSTGLDPSGGSEGQSVLCHSSGVWWLLAALSHPWLVDSSLWSPPLLSHVLPCVSVSSPILVRTPASGYQAALNPG